MRLFRRFVPFGAWPCSFDNCIGYGRDMLAASYAVVCACFGACMVVMVVCVLRGLGLWWLAHGFWAYVLGFPGLAA